MPLKYDLNSIFKELEQQLRDSNLDVDESKEDKPKKSPEDAPETKEVAPATSKTREDVHGGDEEAKEIENSPNSTDEGENSDKKNKSSETKGNGNQNKEDINADESGEEREYFITSNATNPSSIRPSTTPEDLQEAVEKIFEKKMRKQEDFKTKNREEYLKKYILEIIKKIAAQHDGLDKQEGSDTYDKRQMIQHILKHQSYKLLGDKYDSKYAKYVQFFIDTSGVYGCGSNKILHELMPEVIQILEKQGYECYIAACANGFYERDMIEDEYYKTRKTLENYRAGKVNKIACPTVQTAAQMANMAEFSIILADFDGLSSICKMANLCKKEKVPYLLSTEDRYPWENPTLHDWVDPCLCDYDFKLVYDVSMNGNPTLEQYNEKLNAFEEDDEYEYDQSNGYDYDYDN